MSKNSSTGIPQWAEPAMPIEDLYRSATLPSVQSCGLLAKIPYRSGAGT